MAGKNKSRPQARHTAANARIVKPAAGPVKGAPRTPEPPKPVGNSLYERYKDALRRGHVAALRGRLDAAIIAYDEAAAIAPDRSLPHASIGGILVKMSRLDEAVAAYDRALALGPRDETALRGRADVLARLGRRVDAAETLDRLADVLDGAGRLAEACDAARRALELAESRPRRRQVEDFVERLRASSGDQAADRALAQALRFLEPPPPPPLPEPAAAEGEARAEAPSEPEPEVAAEPEPEPEVDAVAVGAAAEAALHAGDTVAAHEGFLAAARAHRRDGHSAAAIDACYLALAVGPDDPELHLLLVDLYLDRGWRSQAADKLLLLGRLAALSDDAATRERLCRVVTEHLPDDARLAELCA
jgi:tetratricopeptide (TPR) repeat protein